MMAAFLAQIMIAPGLETPPRLPGPPAIEHYLYENPYVPMLVLLAAAVLLAVFGPRRWGVRVVLAGSIAVAIGAGLLWLISWSVQTPREVIRARAIALVDAVAKADAQRADPILSESSALFATFTPSAGLPKAEILGRIGGDMSGSYRLHDHRVREVQVLLQGPRVARSHLLVMVDPEQTRVPTWSWWRLDWALETDQWRVTSIEPLSIQGMERSGVR